LHHRRIGGWRKPYGSPGPGSAGGQDGLITACLKGLKEAGEFIRAADPVEVLADGIDADEKQRICREGQEARDAIDDLLSALA
jgi:hypothetical protein